MRAIVNEILHGFGYLIFAIGFLMCMMSLLSVDDPYIRQNLVNYTFCGLLTAVTGYFLTWWTI